MGDFIQIKAAFSYLEFSASFETEIYSKLEDKENHLIYLEKLEHRISKYLEDFDFSEMYELPFVDKFGRSNGYFLRKIATHKETKLKGKLELMVKREK